MVAFCADDSNQNYAAANIKKMDILIPVLTYKSVSVCLKHNFIMLPLGKDLSGSFYGLKTFSLIGLGRERLCVDSLKGRYI